MLGGAIRRAAASELDAVRAFYETQGYRGGALPDDVIIVATVDDAIVGVVLPHSHLAGFYGRIGFREVSVRSAPAFLRGRYVTSQLTWPNIIVMRRPPAR